MHSGAFAPGAQEWMVDIIRGLPPLRSVTITLPFANYGYEHADGSPGDQSRRVWEVVGDGMVRYMPVCL